jgi:hypothetical protein
MSNNRTYFGIPAKNEGPGPSKYLDENKLAFREISPKDIELYKIK